MPELEVLLLQEGFLAYASEISSCMFLQILLFHRHLWVIEALWLESKETSKRDRSQRGRQGHTARICLCRSAWMENKRIPPNTTIELVQTISNYIKLLPIVALWKLAERHLHPWCFQESQVLKSTTVHMASKAGSLTGGGLSLGAVSQLLECSTARAFGKLTKGAQMQWKFAFITY